MRIIMDPCVNNITVDSCFNRKIHECEMNAKKRKSVAALVFQGWWDWSSQSVNPNWLRKAQVTNIKRYEANTLLRVWHVCVCFSITRAIIFSEAFSDKHCRSTPFPFWSNITGEYSIRSLQIFHGIRGVWNYGFTIVPSCLSTPSVHFLLIQTPTKMYARHAEAFLWPEGHEENVYSTHFEGARKAFSSHHHHQRRSTKYYRGLPWILWINTREMYWKECVWYLIVCARHPNIVYY